MACLRADPVPFKLLGDEAKGCASLSCWLLSALKRRVLTRCARGGSWLDTTYLSERVRVSKGNKGTTFILARYDGAA